MDTLTEDDRDALEASRVPTYALEALADYEGGALTREFVEDAEDRYMGEADSARAWAEEYIEDSGMLAEMPDSLRYYFDADAWMADACLEGSLTVVDVGAAVAVFHN